ncbi:MAG: DUF4143 domain-containing protein [Oligoflexales bacterium]|nr:DUF4143 domain-containing protein [Oligoflexales bacterium]
MEELYQNSTRKGQFLNIHEVAGAAGVDQNTVLFCVELLKRNGIIQRVKPYHSNLRKRITKMSKLYFYDTGLCARLQLCLIVK